jgi:hypothetical protein
MTNIIDNGTNNTVIDGYTGVSPGKVVKDVNPTVVSPSISNPTITGTVAGSATYTSPTINTPSISNPTITGTVAGGATYTSPTINTPSISNPTITGTVAGSVTFSAPIFGHGLIPRGAVIATFPHLPGSYYTSATTIPDASGFVLCQGQTIVSGPMIGAVIPDISNSVFLRGSISSGSTIVGTSSRSLSPINLPTLTSTGTVTNNGSTIAANTLFEGAHTHSVGSYTASGSVNLTHSHGISDPGHAHQVQTENTTHSAFGSEPNIFGAVLTGGFVTSGFSGTGISINDSTNLNHSHSISGDSGAGSNHQHSIPSLVVNSGQSVSVTSSGTNGATGLAFNIEPAYINAVYLMRVN